MNGSETIVALATPPGIGGIAILRLSGPRAWEIAAEKSKIENRKSKIEANTAYFTRIERDGELIDEAVFTFFKAPRSYTGEDVVEISCHGGRYAAARVLELILQAGARMARPGEFTERAFLNNKLDLAQAEAVAGIIHARTHRAGQAAARQLAGGLSEKVRAMRGRLLDLLALLELELDFSEEDVEFETVEHRRRTLSELQTEMQTLADTFRRGRLVREGLRVAIAGLPNVGKSTLMNALVGHDRAIVSPEPGTTRDVVEARMEVDGIELILQDTAGIRATGHLIEQQGITRTRQTLEEADVILWVDNVKGASKRFFLDNELRELFRHKHVIEVLNKCDIRPDIWQNDIDQGLTGSSLTIRRSESVDGPWVETHYPHFNSILVSALSGINIDLLRQGILSTLLGEDLGNEEIVIAEARHHNALTRAIESLTRAQTQLKAPTLLASDLRDAVNALGEITGETVGEEILDRIFSKFCIGK
jgi:tRNA modification GTPase